MRKSIFLLVALAVNIMTYAQHKEKDPAKMAEHRTEKMKTYLGLNETQYASVRQINEKYAEKISAARKDDPKMEKRAEIDALRDQHAQEINAVLTPEQQQKWKTLSDEHREKQKEHREKNHEHRKQELKAALSLSDAQEKQMQAAHESFKTKMKTLHDDKTLSESDKKLKATTLKTEHENAVKEILSADQFAKWKDMRKEFKEHRKSGRK